MEYPTKSQLELALKGLAAEVGDPVNIPFRVDVLGVHGGKPPMYSVVILSPAKGRLRDRLAQVLDRSFGLGAASFFLKAPEALRLVSDYGRKPAAE